MLCRVCQENITLIYALFMGIMLSSFYLFVVGKLSIRMIAKIADIPQRILFPVRIADRVAAERAMAAESGCRHRIDSLTVGCTHTVEAGCITQRTPLPGLTLLDDEAARDFAADLDFFPALRLALLRTDRRDITAQRARVLSLLNDCFRPYLHGLRQPPVLHLLAAHGGCYRIRVHYGSWPDSVAWDCVLSYSSGRFVEAEADEAALVQEAYWGNDLTDFLDGRCDEFTTFCRQQFPTEQLRLWVCLATPMLNSDLVIKRIRHHFARAQQGLTPGSWVMALHEG